MNIFFVKIKFCLFVFLFLFCFEDIAHSKKDTQSAESIYDGESFNFYLENDSKSLGGPGTDHAYTNGFRISYVYAQNKIPSWALDILRRSRLLSEGLMQSKVNFGVALGQKIFTPRDTDTRTLISDDRPYAGWLYLGFAVSLREENVEHFLEFDIGSVGPSAYGREVQNSFHQIIETDLAHGWDNQLKNETTLQFFYQRRSRFIRKRNWELIPYYGGSFGNVEIGSHIGGVIRIGVHLPDNFGNSRPSGNDGDSFVNSTQMVNPRASYYMFVGMRGNVIFRNLFLDGNTFEASHRVNKHFLNTSTEFGFGLGVGSWSVVWSTVVQSPEFEERTDVNRFGSVSVTYMP